MEDQTVILLPFSSQVVYIVDTNGRFYYLGWDAGAG